MGIDTASPMDQAAAAAKPELAARSAVASGGAGGISASMNRINSSSSSLQTSIVRAHYQAGWLSSTPSRLLTHRITARDLDRSNSIAAFVPDLGSPLSPRRGPGFPCPTEMRDCFDSPMTGCGPTE